MIKGNKHRRNRPTLGELRNPISLVRSNLVPSGDTQWIQEVSPYLSTFAKFEPGRGVAITEGTNEEDEITHNFIIAEPRGEVIETADYVIYNNSMYKIHATRILEQGDNRPNFLIIMTNEKGKAKNRDFEIKEELDEIEDDPADERSDPGEDLWLM